MNRKLLFLACGMSFTTLGFAQSQKLSPDILSPGGGINETRSGTIEWTLGEIAVSTVNTPSAMYTQGYNQPLLLQRLSSVNSNTDKVSLFNVTVFPNPTTTQLTVHVDSKIDSKVTIQLLDLNGKQLSLEVSGSMNENKTLDLTKYTAGLYLLRITDAAGLPIETFKISKVF